MCKNSLNYNYFISGAKGYFEYGYHDIMNLPNVKYASTIYDGNESPFKKCLIRLNFSREINKKVRNPLSAIVNPMLYPHHFQKDKPICYVFFGTSCDVFQSSYIEYLRKTYKHIKLVLYMQDLVSMVRYFDFEKALKTMDLVITYDQGDSERYGLPYHPTPMSFVEIPDDNNIEESDVYYCGVAKSRYETVHEIYKELTRAGFKCDFNLMSMPENAPRLEGVNYPKHFFSYKENLQHILKSKTVLEIMQEGAKGFTPRLWESIIYDKHLLTNNYSIKESPYFDKNGILFLNEMQTDNLSGMKEGIRYSGDLKKSLSPVHLLFFIDNLLSKL